MSLTNDREACEDSTILSKETVGIQPSNTDTNSEHSGFVAIDRLGYFPNFYGFRLIAALGVVLLHIQLMAGRYHLGAGKLGLHFEVLSLGVDFFFVLSGFLITSLVLAERKKKKFKYWKFYLKRGLRILPLYYLVVIVVFFGVEVAHLPEIHGMPLDVNFKEQLTLHLLLVPQVAKSYLPFLPYGGQLWSIGVEIMFYLLWPMVVLGRRPILAASIFAGSNLTIKILAFLIFGSDHSVSKFLAMSRFEVLAIGGLAYLIYSHTRSPCIASVDQPRLIQLLSRRELAIALAVSGLVATFVSLLIFPVAVHVIAGLCFALILIYSVAGRLKMPFLESSLVRYLGETSYGIYVWHFLAIGVVKGMLDVADLSPLTRGYWWVFWCGSIMVTFLISVISFELLEKPINQLRRLL